jgi:hypothetical protein
VRAKARARFDVGVVDSCCAPAELRRRSEEKLRNPQHLLHGHGPLTRNFASATMLAQLKTDLVWLHDQVLTAVRRGNECAAIHQANLIPPGLLGGQSDVYQPSLSCANTSLTAYTTRTSAIGSRTCKASTISAGPTARNSWSTTSVYRKSSSSRPWSAWPPTASTNWPPRCLNRPEAGSSTALPLVNAKRLVYLKLMEENQNMDPFKFIIYSGKIGEQTPQMASGK